MNDTNISEEREEYAQYRRSLVYEGMGAYALSFDEWQQRKEVVNHGETNDN